MAKTSGQDNISPPEEKIEMIATVTIGSILAAMEKKIIQSIEAYEFSGAVQQPTKDKRGKDAKLDKINAERLEAFREGREKRNAG